MDNNPDNDTALIFFLIAVPLALLLLCLFWGTLA